MADQESAGRPLNILDVSSTKKSAAYAQFYWAIKFGILKRPDSCEKCGIAPERTSKGRAQIHGHHHRGYDHPLDVMWLCPKCHSQEDRANVKQLWAKRRDNARRSSEFFDPDIDYLRRDDAVDFLSAIGCPITKKRLARFEIDGDGPPFNRECGGSRYKEDDLRKWAATITERIGDPPSTMERTPPASLKCIALPTIPLGYPGKKRGRKSRAYWEERENEQTNRL